MPDSPAPRLDIAVIGAGIGGLTAALCLARRGHAVTVYEQAEALTEAGAGLQIGPNGMHVLARLGLAEAVLRHATLPEAVEMRAAPSGRRVARVTFGRTVRARHGQPYVQLHRADLLGVLAAAVEAAGVPVRLGAPIDADGLPPADLVIGADGLRSGLRRRLCPEVRPAFTGQTAWRALVPAAAGRGLAAGRTHLFMGPGAHLVAYPLRAGSIWNIVAVAERDSWVEESRALTADPAEIRAAFAGWPEPVTGLLEAVESACLWGLFAHGPLPRWQDGRIALLGDACHPMLPFLAQGATMAIEDAWVLADCLDRAPPVRALPAYETARKPRTARVQAAARRNARLYHLAPGPLRTAFHAGLGVAQHGPGGLLRPFDWLYGRDVTR